MKEFWERTLWDLCYERYGRQLPEPMQRRLQQEIEMIRPYFDEKIFRALLKISQEFQKNHIYFSLGSMAGCSMVAFVMGLTPINPLPAHYHCTACHHVEFAGEEKDGFDLPDKICPVCGERMHGDGHNLSAWWVQRSMEDDRYLHFEIRTAEEVNRAGVEILKQYFPVTPCFDINGTHVRWILGNVEPEQLREFPGDWEDGKKKVGVFVEDRLPQPSILFVYDEHRERLLKLSKMTGRGFSEIPLNDEAARRVLQQKILDSNQDDKIRMPLDDLRRGVIQNCTKEGITAEALVKILGVETIHVRHPEQLSLWAVENFFDRDAALAQLVRQGVDEATAVKIADFTVRRRLPCEMETVRERLDQELLAAVENTIYLFPRANRLLWIRLQLQLAWFEAHEATAYHKVMEEMAESNE